MSRFDSEHGAALTSTTESFETTARRVRMYFHLYWACRALLLLVLLFVVDRGLYLALDAGFRRIEVGETGGMVNHAIRSKADVFVVGSSRAWHHYDTRVLEAELGRTAYNAGCDGQGVPYMYALVELILQYHRPGLLIVDIDPRFLVRADHFYDRATVLAPFIDESPAVREILQSRGVFEPFKYISRAFRYNSKPLAILRNLGVRNATLNGFVPIDRIISTSSTMPAAAPHRPQPTFDLRLLEMLRRMIRLARGANVPVVLVNSPSYAFDDQDDLADLPILQQLHSLAAQEMVPYIRISLQNTPELRHPRFFADTTHLNREGAQIFTQVVTNKIAELGVRTSQSAPVISQP